MRFRFSIDASSVSPDLSVCLNVVSSGNNDAPQSDHGNQ